MGDTLVTGSGFVVLSEDDDHRLVGMWESRVRCEISKSLWEPLFGFHRDGISTAVCAVVVLAREFGGCSALDGQPLVAPGAPCAVVLIGQSLPQAISRSRVARPQAAGSDPIRRPCHAGVNRRVWRSMRPSSTCMKRTRQSPRSVSASPTSSPRTASHTKIRSPCHLIWPDVFTRRTWWVASYHGSSSRAG